MKAQEHRQWTSASNALADRLCRGRHQAQRNLPELPASPLSQAGVVIHALWTGTEPSRAPTAEEIEKADTLRQQEAVVAKEFFSSTKGLVRLVEQRLWHELPSVEDRGASPGLKTSGQFDVALVQPQRRRALVCDGKSGWLPVTPNSSNLQLRRLAALLWLQLNCQEIGVCILKPFGTTDPPCLYSVGDLERAVQEMEEDVRQSHFTEAPRTAGQEQCRYCRARETCAPRLAWLSAALPPGFPPLPRLPAREWTGQQRVLFLEREKDARDWLETRKEELKALLAQEPDAVPGYGLRPGRVIETIHNPQRVWERFCTNLGGSLEAFLKCIRVGKTALKEEVRALKGHKGKVLESDLDDLLAGCVESTASAPTIERLR